MSRPRNESNCLAGARPAGQVLLPALSIGLLSLGLAAGLEFTGLAGRLDRLTARLVSRGGSEEFPKALPSVWVWLAGALFACGLAAAMLATPGMHRRAGLWLGAVFLVSTWAPVLSLAAHEPRIAAPWIATVWSGVCAMIYTSRHRMPCDGPSPAPP